MSKETVFKNGSIFVGQAYPITLNTKRDLSGATGMQILAIKPDATTASYTAGVTGMSKLTYTMTSSDNNQAGVWKFQASANFQDGLGSIPGETFVVPVKSLGAETSPVDT